MRRGELLLVKTFGRQGLHLYIKDSAPAEATSTSATWLPELSPGVVLDVSAGER